MSEGIEISVRNQLVGEKRDLNVYHHSARGAYMISYNSIVNIPLETQRDGDYLHLSIVSGPGSLEKNCWLDMPSWCDFTVSSIGNGELTHRGERILVKIPPGPPVWQLKITRVGGSLTGQPGDHVTVGDGESIAAA